VGGATATPKHSSRRPTRTGGTVRGQGQLGGTPIQNQKAMAFILENGIPWTRHLCDLAEQAQAARSG
jgi:cell division protein FtsI/penicillin-binding protein 2